MSPEAAALVGVGIGAILSLVGSLVVNERSQAAERKRLETQFAESVKKEQRDAAYQARRQRLQPALDLLSALEQMIGAHLESSALDAVKPQIEEQMGPIEDWTKMKSDLARSKPLMPTEVVGSYFPKIQSIPVSALVAELTYLVAVAAANPIPRMSTDQRNDLFTKVRGTRNMVDSEIIRGDWP